MSHASRGRRAAAENLGLIEKGSRSGKGRKRRLPDDRAILGRLFRKIGRIVLRIAVTFLLGSIALTILYRFVDPPLTPLMLIRPLEGLADGELVGISKEWIDIDDVDPLFLKSVIAAEDARFFEHGGIDWKAVEDAREYNERHKGEKIRGASTITMQCARNVFLWQGRNYIRKALEAWFTYLIEFFWGKKRILEVYINVVEWGDGMYGIETASQFYFDRSSGDLTSRQAALLAAVLPNPRYWSPADPNQRVISKANRIQKGARIVRLDGLRP